MSNSPSFWDHPIEKLEEALNLRKQIAALQNKLSGLLGGNGVAAAQSKAAKKAGKRTMSPATIAKMRAAQRARWAKSKGEQTTKSSGTDEAALPAKAAKAPKKKSGLTDEGRAKLASAMKARWAARRKGAPALNTPVKKSKNGK
jgi:hypothetical protein